MVYVKRALRIKNLQNKQVKIAFQLFVPIRLWINIFLFCHEVLVKKGVFLGFGCATSRPTGKQAHPPSKQRPCLSAGKPLLWSGRRCWEIGITPSEQRLPTGDVAADVATGFEGAIASSIAFPATSPLRFPSNVSRQGTLR